MSNQRLTMENYHNICKQYTSGQTLKSLADEYKISDVHVLRILKNFDVDRKTDRTPKSVKPIEQLDSAELMYWTGFLLADGHISKRTKQIRLTLSIDDIEHVKKYKQFFGLGHNITISDPSTITVKDKTYTSKKKSTIQFRNKQYYTWLTSNGVDEFKSSTCNISDACASSRDFWRGFIDGDGCIYTDKAVVGRPRGRLSIELCGLKGHLDLFKTFVLDICPEFKGNVRIKKLPLYTIRIGSNNAEKLAGILYQSGDQCLDRKANKISQYLETADVKSRNKAGNS